MLLVARYKAFTPEPWLLGVVAGGLAVIGLLFGLLQRYSPQAIAASTDQRRWRTNTKRPSTISTRPGQLKCNRQSNQAWPSSANAWPIVWKPTEIERPVMKLIKDDPVFWYKSSCVWPNVWWYQGEAAGPLRNGM